MRGFFVYVAERKNEILNLLIQHIGLTLASVEIGRASCRERVS